MRNVCIVGYGAIGPVHAFAVSQTENARFYAVCDIAADNIALAQNEYHVKAYTDFDQMLLDESIDSVHICTPHYLHFDMIKKALANGKDVVCEKPVTMTRCEYDELLALPNAEKVCVVLQNRLNPCVQRFKEIVLKGELGRVKASKAILTWFRSREYYDSADWRGKWDTEGGGALINQAVHTLDLFPYIVDDISAVRAQISNFSLPEIEVEDTVSARFKLNCGAIGVFYATTGYKADSEPEFEVIFENGTVCYRNGKLFINDCLEEENSPTKLGKSYWGNGHITLIKQYYEENKFFSPFDAKNTMEALFAVYESASKGGKEIIL